jgi:hypothetical protein
MGQTIVLSFLVGLMLANGTPHFVRGITKERYPCLFGNGPVPNLVAGWAMFVIAALVARATRFGEAPVGAPVAGALGALAMGLFHAHVGAFGRKE